MSVEFSDYSIHVKGVMNEAMKRFLREAAFIVESETIRHTPTDKEQLRNSWASDVNEADMSAMIGSPLEQAFWNEFGTGSHALHGDGRKGWWVYIEGQERGVKNSKVYATKEDAEQAVAFLRSKGLPAVATNGEDPHRTLENAFAAKKQKIINMAEQILKGMGNE